MLEMVSAFSSVPANVSVHFPEVGSEALRGFVDRALVLALDHYTREFFGA
jgi:hypothetical protein